MNPKIAAVAAAPYAGQFHHQRGDPVGFLKSDFREAVLSMKKPARAWWQRELSLAACLMRLDIYALILLATLITGSGMSLGNDEPIAARLWGLPSLALVFVLLVPFLWIAVTVARSAWRRWSSLGAQFIVRAIIMFAVGILVGSVLDPWLFSRH
jgi:hypothetical protein